MVDRFKFRVWSNKTERYLTGDEMELVLEFNRELDGTDHFFVCHQSAIEADYVFEQCTGLKDKSGRSFIFEDDILRVGRGQIGTKLRFTIDLVEWSGPGGGWTFREVPNQHREWSFLEDRLEIIGNIHENPELLKE